MNGRPDLRGNHAYAYGALNEAVRMFLNGTITREQLAANRAVIEADLDGAPTEAAS